MPSAAITQALRTVPIPSISTRFALSDSVIDRKVAP
jgi:hypothetical protein